MIEFFNENGELVAKQERDRDFTIDEVMKVYEDGKTIYNKNYDSKACLQKYLDQGIRRERKILFIKFDHIRSTNDFPELDMLKISNFRKRLRGITKGVTMWTVGEISLPEIPEKLRSYIL